jgi:pyruvate formate lyase activating enzyme
LTSEGGYISEERIEEYLVKRRKYLDGVVVSGGEPTLHKELPNFLRYLKGKGYPVKLDTNGSNPQMLKSMLKEGLLDFVAMDIKAPLEKYGELAGTLVNVSDVKKSIELLMNGDIPYEFRTTVVKELLTHEDVVRIGQDIKGAKRFALQKFHDREEVLAGIGKFTSCTPEEMKMMAESLKEDIGEVLIR